MPVYPPQPNVSPVDHTQLPYTEEDLDSLRALRRMRGSTDVAHLRDTYGADLVQFIGSFDDVCGRA